jgi:hypothetical protein
MHTDKAALTAISEKIIGCAFIVLNTLGVGFLENRMRGADRHGGTRIYPTCGKAVAGGWVSFRFLSV